MKHYKDIDNIREEENGMTVPNTGAFEVGDHINITEKVDGANASFRYVDGQLVAFSRKKELDAKNNLSGFWNFVHGLDASEYADEPNHIYFGEWLIKHTVKYEPECMDKFYLFDVYDTDTETWLPKDEVWKLWEKHGGYCHVPVLFDGTFVSWTHCRSFMHSPALGDTQEGIVIVNLDKLNKVADDDKNPPVIKIVNAEFRETKAHKVKQSASPEEVAEKERIFALVQTIVTEQRVNKTILKLRDEGVLPTVLEPKDMRLVSTVLPKAIYEDCEKEEPETVAACGINAGKFIYSETMSVARNIILGK